MRELSRKMSKIKASSTLVITAIAKTMKAKGIDVVSFGPGEPDFDTPNNIKLAGIAAINSGFTKYTVSSGVLELRTAICDKLKDDNGLVYTPNQIIVSNGAKHALNNVLAAILNPSDEVIIPAPYWLSYYEMVNMADGVPVFAFTKESEGFNLTLDLLESVLTDKTKAIIINSPNNPTGVVYSESTLRMIADFAVKHDLYVIADEVYEKLIYDDDQKHISIASFNEDIFKRTIVINGLSKSFSMTGWRIGYSACNSEIATIIDNIQSHGTSNISSITQKAAIAALTEEHNEIEEMRQAFIKRRDYIYRRINEIKHIHAVRPQGAFYVFVNVEELCGREILGKYINDATDLAALLIEQTAVAVVPCDDFGFSKHIRLSYPISREEIERGLNRIEKFINECY